MKIDNLKSVKGFTSLRFSLVGLALLLFQYGSAIPAVGEAASLNESFSSSVQDERAVSGVVTDAAGEPLIAVSVVVKGTTIGTATDFDGNFHLVLPEGSNELVISYLGFRTETINVAGKRTVSIVMHEDTQALDELVVTALGIKREKKALSYNAQEIKQEDLTRTKNPNLINSLNSRVAGVTINSGSSGPGSATKVVMRGAKSIDKSNSALYVIDGIPMLSMSYNQGQGRFHSSGATEGVADINPEDIESMTVLTGAAAAALYGSAAANGAVIITTKRGTAGKVKLSISSSSEIGNPFILPEFQNRYGSEGQIESWGKLLSESSPKYSPTDFFNTAHTLTNSFTLSGGSEKNQSFLSASSTNAQGIIPNNTYNRYNFTFTNTTYLLNDDLKIDFSSSFIMQNNRNMVNQGEYMNPLVGAYLLSRGYGLDKTKVFERYNSTRGIYEQSWGDFSATETGLFGGGFAGEYSLQNPYWVAYRNLREMARKRYMASVGISYNILKWSDSEKWDVSSRIRTDNTRYSSTDKRYASTLSTHDVSKNGYFGFEEGVERQTYVDFLTNLNKTLIFDNIGKFQLNVNLGASLQDSRVDGSFSRGPIRNNGIPNFFNTFQIDPTVNKSVFGQNGWAEQTQSVFGSLEVGYNDYLYLSLTGRNDWASQLVNSPNSSFFYPSVGLSWIVTEMLTNETREKMSPILSFLKAKIAYSSVASPFPRELTSPTYKFDNEDKVWKSVSHYPVGKLYPERTNSFETGFSSKWINNSLSFDMTYYLTNTYNQTIRTDMSASSGYDAFYVQTGNVRNWGIESALGYKITSNDVFSWDTYFTVGYNKNKIASLMENYLNPITGENESKESLTKQEFGGLRYILKTGGSIGDIYSVVDFKRDMDGNIFVGEDGSVTSENFPDGASQKIGSVLPDYNLGWKNDFRIKNISFGALVSGRIGGVVVSMTQAALDHYGVSKTTADARDADGVQVNGMTIDSRNYFNVRGKNRIPQYYSYSATSIRLQEAYIGYVLPQKWFNNKMDCSISLVGRNLLMLYSKAPFDPEVISSTGNYAQGLDYFMLPSLRSFALNLKLNF